MITLLQGDCLERLKNLPDTSVQMCVTSPPYYGLRDYGVDGQIGLESSVDAYVAKLVAVFREVRRVLKDDGVLWLNLGDSYSTHAAGKVADPMAKSTLEGTRTQEVANVSSRARGEYRKCLQLPEKNLIGIPWRVAFALQADGWTLRQDIIWHKPNAMPESVKDRCTKAHEYLFLLSKQARYYFDAEAIKETASWNGKSGTKNYRPNANGGRIDAGMNSGGPSEVRNRRSVWSVPTTPLKSAHFAVFPHNLIEPCILAGSRPGDVILDPFGGAGTTALVARAHGRQSVLIELNADYIEITKNRLGLLEEVA